MLWRDQRAESEPHRLRSVVYYFLRSMKEEYSNLHWQIQGGSSDAYSPIGIKMLLLPAATKLDQGNVFTGVCDSVHRGVSASMHAGIPPPRIRHPPGADTPQEQTPPGSRLQHTVNERPVRILLECILVFIQFLRKKDQMIGFDTHPKGWRPEEILDPPLILISLF